MKLFAEALLHAIDDNVFVRLAVAGIEAKEFLLYGLGALPNHSNRMKPVEACEHLLTWLIHEDNRLRFQLFDRKRIDRGDVLDPEVLCIGMDRKDCQAEEAADENNRTHHGLSIAIENRPAAVVILIVILVVVRAQLAARIDVASLRQRLTEAARERPAAASRTSRRRAAAADPIGALPPRAAVIAVDCAGDGPTHHTGSLRILGQDTRNQRSRLRPAIPDRSACRAAGHWHRQRRYSTSPRPLAADFLFASNWRPRSRFASGDGGASTRYEESLISP